MDEFTGVDGSMSLADVGKREMIEEIKSYPAVTGAKFMKYTYDMAEPGLLVTINNFVRNEINMERRGRERYSGPLTSWEERFTDFVQQFGYVYDGAEPDDGRVRPGPVPRKVVFYFKPA